MVTHRETACSPGDISKPNPNIRIGEAMMYVVVMSFPETRRQ